MIDGATTTVKVAHVRLCHSRMLFVRAYPRETQEMVFDAHDKAFAFFGWACTRAICDSGNCPPLVRGQWTRRRRLDTNFVGRDRACNRRFRQMCGHYLADPVACTPASGWERAIEAPLVRAQWRVGRSRTRPALPGDASSCPASSRACTHALPGSGTPSGMGSLQGPGAAISDQAHSAQTGQGVQWRPADGPDPEHDPRRWAGCSGCCLCRSAE